MSEDNEALARLMIAEVNTALARGTKHYDQAGNLLETPMEIVDCLLREGGVTFEPRRCLECGTNAADFPSRLCPGCEAYRAHTA